MTREEAKYIFRGIQPLADALGLTRQAIYKWPEELTEKQENAVIGAALRLGLDTDIPATALMRIHSNAQEQAK